MFTISNVELAQTREITFHVFTNNRDVWRDSYGDALKIYRQFKHDYGSARLYIELYHNRENDDMIREECLRSFGPYPT